MNRIYLEGINYDIPENKIENLKKWMIENELMSHPEPSDEQLVVDIENTKGLEIEFDETKEKKEEGNKKSHES